MPRPRAPRSAGRAGELACLAAAAPESATARGARLKRPVLTRLGGLTAGGAGSGLPAAAPAPRREMSGAGRRPTGPALAGLGTHSSWLGRCNAYLLGRRGRCSPAGAAAHGAQAPAAAGAAPGAPATAGRTASNAAGVNTGADALSAVRARGAAAAASTAATRAAATSGTVARVHWLARRGASTGDKQAPRATGPGADRRGTRGSPQAACCPALGALLCGAEALGGAAACPGRCAASCSGQGAAKAAGWLTREAGLCGAEAGPCTAGWPGTWAPVLCEMVAARPGRAPGATADTGRGARPAGEVRKV